MNHYIKRLKDAVEQVTLLKKEVMGDLPISEKKEILERAQEISSNKALKPPVTFEDTENYCHFSEEPPETDEEKVIYLLEVELMDLVEDMDSRIVLDSGFYKKAEGEETVRALDLKDYNVDDETAKTFSVGDVFMAINGQWMIKVGAEDYRAWTWVN
ncbi:MAG: hypothetical protein CL512_04870 [Actinobacteria bacterium]|nr:hypothetical protein [Actinomycetota bacterium]|tara:strand:- start:68 stop:538 length:471 start_codon:yes stop_codon:yes gene_type:complete